MAFALPDHGTNPTASLVSTLPHSYPHNFNFTDLVSAQTSLARVLGVLGSCRPLVGRFRSSALRLVFTRPKAPVGADSVSVSPIDPSWADIFFPLAQHEQVAGTYVVSTSHPSTRVLTLIPP
ncbi:hypothetical protein BC826DRAFT_1024671 [Russula brevipes]|nr:hypothetical protein BC826DRAFT_1024671 [Russula brevipes]